MMNSSLPRAVLLTALAACLLVSACGPGLPAPAQVKAVPAPEPTEQPAAEIDSCQDPSMSVIAVSGDGPLTGESFHYLDTASAFLTGRAYPASSSGWRTDYSAADDTRLDTRLLQHESEMGLARYYYDPERLMAGEALDADPTYGIDQAMMLFYTGHGDPEQFHVIDGDVASPDKMRLGNCSSGGQLRYFWQCSCQSFAHGPDTGPKVCGSSAEEVSTCYDDPGSWDGSGDSFSMRNVFDRWGPALDPSLRMACGASTDVPCNPAVTEAMWKNLLEKDYDVADSFINALWQTGNVALCIALGGSDVATSPLVTDTDLMVAANTAGTSHYHMEYAQPFAEPYRSVRPAGEPPPVPAELPLLMMESESPIETREGERSLQFDEELSEEAYIATAQGYLKEFYPDLAPFTAPPAGVHMRLASMPVDSVAVPGDGAMQIVQKNAVISFKRRLNLAEIMQEYTQESGLDIPEGTPEFANVLGPGGTIEIQLNNDGTLLSATKSWHEQTSVVDVRPTIDYEVAQSLALGWWNDESYQIGSWNWGYLEYSDQSSYEVEPFYEFWLVATKGSPTSEFPPQLIYIPAFQ